jgi:transcriptional regulator with XRE-family HTH domain
MVKNLKSIREEKKISQKEIANHLGIAPSAYNRYEKDGEPNIDKLKQIAIYLDTTLDELCDMPEKHEIIDTELEEMKQGLAYLLDHLTRKEIDKVLGYCASLIEKRNK